MKTLREYIDILDEISRRDFLKGAGAAAAGAAMGQAKGQVGAGENESAAATRQAISQWSRLARDNQLYTKSLNEILQKRIYQFYQMSKGVNFANSTSDALQASLDVVRPEFERLEKILEKEKGDSSLGKAYLLHRFGMENLSRQEQLKRIGSMQLVDLESTANRFLQTYTDSLNKSLQGIQQQSPQQSDSDIKQHPILTKRYDDLNMALSAYYFSKDTNKNVFQEMQRALKNYIDLTGNKELVNSGYKVIKDKLDDMKISNPEQWENRRKAFLANYKKLIQKLEQEAPEFKESQALEESEPEDPISKIHRLFR